MKKTFRITIEGEEMTVSVERQGDELLVERDGESYRVGVMPAGPPAVTSEHNDASSGEVQAAGKPQVREPAQPSPSAATTRSDSSGPPTSARAATGIPAPITGTIKEVLIKTGESISQGERVMMMEAMKMDIEIVAPASGRVMQVFVKEGDSVRENQPLFRIE